MKSVCQSWSRIRERSGTDHSYVFTSPCTLAEFCVVQGRCAEAKPLYKRALVISERRLGPEHPNVAAKVDRALAGANRSSLLVMIALGFGGILTIAWTSILIWTAGYVVGVW